MNNLDWGKATPEAVNKDTNTFIYVYNHDLTSEEKVNRTIRFILGRLNYCDSQLPQNAFHAVKIDCRGQQLTYMTYQYLEKEIRSKYSGLNTLSIDLIK